MHFGSWELASLSCAMLHLPYKVMVKPQTRYSRLDELLNWYRSCGGYVVLSRGMGTRDFVRSLKNNEVIGMVVDQGGRDGTLVPFFGRNASMSVGAIRMGLKWGVPICFSIIHREPNGRHKMIVHKPLELINTGNPEKDIPENLNRITGIMEDYIRRYPSEYMWFYKIWKYSNETAIAILNDGKTGHLRQSQAVAGLLQKALGERSIFSTVATTEVVFKTELHRNIFSVFNLLVPPFLSGTAGMVEMVSGPGSFQKITRIKAEFIVSCGSGMAGVNNFYPAIMGRKVSLSSSPACWDTGGSIW